MPRNARSIVIPTEPVGSIPRPAQLKNAVLEGGIHDHNINSLVELAIKDTVDEFDRTSSPVITDGEQSRLNTFASYCIDGSMDFSESEIVFPIHNNFDQQGAIKKGPFRYQRYAFDFLKAIKPLTGKAVKQTLVSPSVLSLLYPLNPISGYSRDQFIEDILGEHEKDILSCLENGAYSVQIDFAESRMAYTIDPSGQLLNSFVQLNNMALEGLTPDQLRRVGVHICMDRKSEAACEEFDRDFPDLLPILFNINVGFFSLAVATEKNKEELLRAVRDCIKPWQRIFVGVVDPNNPSVESPELIKERVLEAAQYIPVAQLGTTDDCGFSPCAKKSLVNRETAFAKISARVEGTALAEKELEKFVL